MKIIQMIPVFDLAGAEVMCENLSYELQRAGHEVVVVSMYSTRTAITDRLEKANIRVVYLDKKSGLDFSIKKKMRKLFLQEKPDVIHCHLYVLNYAVSASRGLGIPKVYTVHNIATKDAEPLYQKLYYKYFRKENVQPVALSELVQDTIVERYELPKERVPVILNGINLDKCIPKQSYEAGETVKFIHVGRFTEQKNHRMMITAFAKAHETQPNVELYLYGTGELEEECKALAKELGAETYIHFCGTTSDVYSVMTQMDAFLLPSLWEGVPMTLIEAMGTAMPIIASAVGGVADMLTQEESALLIEPKEEQIAAAICRLAADPVLRETLGKAALERSDVFSSKHMVKAYEDVYRKVM